MKKNSLLLSLVALLAITSLPTSSAHAQNARSYVSGTGSDVNPCSRTQPCSSFPTAMDKTSAGGEINCLDTGTYGVFNITKSITIDCSGTLAEVFVAGGNAVRIHAGASDKITIRGLKIQGTGAASISGIFLGSGAELHIEDVMIENFSVAGIAIEATNRAIVTVRNVTMQRGPLGIRVNNSVPNAAVSIDNTRFNNLANGVVAGTNSYVAVSNSIFSTNGLAAISSTAATSTVYAEKNVITNSAVGLNASVAGARISANANSIYGSGSKAFNVAAGAILLSGGGNNIDINPGNPATGSQIWK